MKFISPLALAAVCFLVLIMGCSKPEIHNLDNGSTIHVTRNGHGCAKKIIIENDDDNPVERILVETKDHKTSRVRFLDSKGKVIGETIFEPGSISDRAGLIYCNYSIENDFQGKTGKYVWSYIDRFELYSEIVQIGLDGRIRSKVVVGPYGLSLEEYDGRKKEN